MENYIKGIKKSLKGLLKRAPMLIEFVMEEGSISINEVLENGKLKFLFNYDINYNLDIKESIHQIKTSLLEFYPIIIDKEVKEESYSAMELNHLIEIGEISIEDNLEDYKKIVTSIVEWRIEKIIVMKDEVIIRSLDTDTLYRYKMNIPVTVFLRNFRDCNDDDRQERYYKIFKNKADLIEEVYEETVEG